MEPHRLRRWRIRAGPATPFYTCARPGRSKGAGGRVSDKDLNAWVEGLPAKQNVVIVSLLGWKPDGTSEYSFYGFHEHGHSWQEWLDRIHPGSKICVMEFPTTDFQKVPQDVLDAVAEALRRLVSEKKVVILVDSGGETRTKQVCKFVEAVEDFAS